MSFYFDDDNDTAPSNNVLRTNNFKAEEEEEEFVCFNCGGTDSYIDDTGEPCCSQCFTQSQTTARATQEEMEDDDVFGLVARTQRGTVMTRRRNKSIGGNRTGRDGVIGNRKPLESYNQATPLPSLEHCLLGIQRVLHETSFIVCDLAGVATDDDHYDKVLESIKSMWSAYLHAWHEGAEFYGSIYPEVRFSFRDAFLGPNILNKILANLSHQVTERVKKEQQAQRQISVDKEQHRVGEDNRDDIDGFSGNQEDLCFPDIVDPVSAANSTTLADDDGLGSACSDLTEDDDEGEQHTSSKSRNYLSIIQGMLSKHQTGHTVLKRREAALVLKPSMTMVASMLWLAVSPLGVTASHIVGWLSNGSLPLLNAFRLLTEEEKKYLHPITPFFQLTSIPTVDTLQRTVSALQIACGYKPPTILIRKKRDRPLRANATDATRATSPTPATSGSTFSTKKKSEYQASLQKQFEKAGRMITPAAVPMVTARLVSDLQFGKTVLNFALALMGLPTAVPVRSGDDKDDDSDEENDDSTWLPPSLKAARPDRLVEPAHILGVILVACKLIPGWDRWSFIRPMAANHSSSAMEDDDVDSNGVAHTSIKNKSNVEEERDAKRRKTHHAQRRFVPWNEEHFRLLGNGQTMESYLEFLEEHMVECTNTLLPDFVASLNLSDNPRPTPMEDDDDNERLTVRPCPDLVVTNINTAVTPGGRPFKRLKNHAYEPCKKHAESNAISRPHPPQLGLLIEYMAYKSGTQSSDIVDFCVDLDEEIAARFGTNDQNLVNMHPLGVLEQVTDSSMSIIEVRSP